MNDERRIAALEAQLETLTARVDDIFDALKFESSSTTGHLSKTAKRIDRLYAHVVDLRECLNLAFRKLYPGVAEDHKKINAILQQEPPPDTKAT
jgi:hypothetical protein